MNHADRTELGKQLDRNERANRVESLNGAVANVAAAAARAGAADTRRDVAEKNLLATCALYRAARAMVLDIDTDAGARVDALRELEGHIDQIDTDVRELQRARAEHGTAHAMLGKARTALDEARSALAKALPEVAS